MIKPTPFRILFSLSLLFASLILVSCKDKEEPAAKDNNEIVGSWKLSAVAPATSGEVIQELALLPSIAPCYLDLVYVYKDDNTVSVSGCDQATNALSTFGLLNVGSSTKWKVENGRLEIKNDSNTQSFALTQAGDKMSMIVVLDQTNTKKNVLLSFERQ
ncbi:lipocalin family protein [Dyadobacter tibetensis]|uniref:lipocalin family protein n=1 Tax=Dyadobacter tibetensis TaxID=1211851 RepID=UPI0004726BC6|nr:lipocalin family protein [Dyadobacter tibetensis]